MSHLFVADMTAEFTARFGTGATGTFRYGFYMDLSAVNNYNNLSIKLYITYEYDDTAHATRVKTVRIPIESFNGRLSNSAQIIRQGSITDQIPALDTFLPESSKVYRQIFAELWTNTLPSNAADCTLSLKIGTGGGVTSFGLIGNTLISPMCLRFLWDLTSNADLTKNASHDIYANHEVASQTYFNHLGGWITVTYEYNHSSSTEIMNSLIIKGLESSSNTRLLADLDKDSVDLYVEEPGTITLKNSGIFFMSFTAATSTTLNFGAGSQTVTGYTPTAGTGMSGMLTFIHRIDGGGFRGAGLTLARGKNVIDSRWYAADIDRVSTVSGLVFINYTSGKHASGDGVHNQSRHYLLFPNNRATNTILVLAGVRTPKIIPQNYFSSSTVSMLGAGVSGSGVYSVVQAKRQSGEGVGEGWEDLLTVMGTGANERMFNISWGRCRGIFKRWPLDPDTSKLNLLTARNWRFIGITQQLGMSCWMTHHSITFTVSGNVKYYTGDGSGLTVNVHRTDTSEKVLTCTTSAGGAYTGQWYDNTIELFAEVQQDSTHAGRSINGVAA
jgi:hypothetical protein